MFQDKDVQVGLRFSTLYILSQNFHNASLELQCRENMEIGTKKHISPAFKADLEGLKAMEIGAKQCDKKGPFFGPQKRKKKQTRKNGPS